MRCVFVIFAIALSVFGVEATVSQDMVRLDEMLQGYYRNPRPDTVPDMLRLLDKAAKAYRERDLVGMEMPVIGFFSEVFRANPDRLDEWDKVVNGLSSKPLKLYLFGALCYADTDKAREVFRRHSGWSAFTIRKRYGNGEVAKRILQWEHLSPGELDACWGAFFASGNRDYVKKVMECALDVPEGDVIDLATGAARWSMLANAERHPIVAEVMNRLLENASDASFVNFTEAMAARQRAELLEDDARARTERLKVPLPTQGDEVAASPPSSGRKPLPAKGADVDYGGNPLFRRLYAQAQGQHKLNHGGNGRIVKGKLLVEGQENSVQGVASKAVFAGDGLFVAPLYAGRILRFVKHGYEPLDIELPKQLNGLPGPDLDLGEQTLHRLPEDRTVAMHFELELPEGVPQARVELWTGELPSTWDDDGYDERARISALSGQALRGAGTVTFSGLTPMPYELRLAAPGCMFCRKAFDAASERDLGTIALQRIRTATFRMAKYGSPEATQEMEVPVDGRAELVMADKPDQFGQYDGFRLTYQDATHLGASFSYGPNFFDDYGAMGLEEFLELRRKGALPAPKTVKGRATLEAGHLYRFRCDMRKHDVLLLFSGME